MNKKVKIMVVVVAVLMVLGLASAIAYARMEDQKPQQVNGKVSLDQFDGQPVMGKQDAPVTIVEFGDFKCPGCGYFATNYFSKLKKDFIDTGRANFKFVNYPFVGPDSLTAAAASEYVWKNSPDDFWKYYEGIFKNQKDEKEVWATTDALISIAKEAGVHLDFSDMKRSIDTQEFEDVVVADLNFARSLGINSTPTFVVNGYAIKAGGLSYDQIKDFINSAIKKGGK
ncbi:thioredoxin domain-containing protein [Paenibacillus sp. Y412MC10]|uniref:DsbA family protein n=1 Tax=Geobacillus sp. (strain Y412MC10) TaxID=481743 RepID=UPI0011AB6C00|nr:thioredoxin domain-containing protein [Paenibacillus sp. Y412MC10]